MSTPAPLNGAEVLGALTQRAAAEAFRRHAELRCTSASEVAIWQWRLLVRFQALWLALEPGLAWEDVAVRELRAGLELLRGRSEAAVVLEMQASFVRVLEEALVEYEQVLLTDKTDAAHTFPRPDARESRL